MDETLQSLILENLTVGVVFFAIGIIFSWIAYLKGYFSLPSSDSVDPEVKLRHVISIYLIFIFAYVVLTPMFLRLLFELHFFAPYHEMIMVFIQPTLFFLVSGFIFLYSLFQNKTTMLSIWKDNTFAGAKPISFDCIFGLLSYLISMPAVIAMGQFAFVVALLMFGPIDQEQLAVRYMKEALQTPLSMIAALFSILIAAPLIEEFLFRGILQSYLRTKVGKILAIFSSALLFALFHFSFSQKAANIPLIASLFTFATYLGFSYEKTRSLWTSIVLHVTFNAVSVIRIIFTTF